MILDMPWAGRRYLTFPGGGVSEIRTVEYIHHHTDECNPRDTVYGTHTGADTVADGAYCPFFRAKIPASPNTYCRNCGRSANFHPEGAQEQWGTACVYLQGPAHDPSDEEVHMTDCEGWDPAPPGGP